MGGPKSRACVRSMLLPWAVVVSFAVAVGSTSAAGQGPVLVSATGPSAAPEGSLAEAIGRVEDATARRERVDAEIAGLLQQRNAARRRMRARVRALYRMRRAGVLPLSGGFEALLRHQSRVERLERMVVRDVEALRSLERRVAALRDETARIAAEVEAAERRVSALRERERAEQSQLAMLSQMIEDPGAWSGPSAGFGVRLSDGAELGPRFADRRGQLPLPVGGSARISDGEREGGGGLEIATTSGVTVRAVGGGRVAYAAPHPAYGRLVIVDHGDGHYTVYGGLGAVAVTAGTPVARDAVLGTVGDQPVFFQVRRGTRPLPAREWLGI